MKRERTKTLRLAWGELLALAIGVTIAPMAHAAIPASERQALLDLYASTNGGGWTDHTGWGGAAGTECDWYGVACDSSGAHVSRVELNSNNLSGKLPDLSGLSSVTIFRVSDNNISGALPSLLGMTSLSYFSAASNHLEGQIPALAGMASLRNFYVSDNNFTGSIPAINGLNLDGFQVDYNRLTGSVPSLDGLTEMRLFSVSHNRLTGQIPPLSGLGGLEYVDFGSNLFTGSIPSLDGLANLNIFMVDDNQLNGRLPSLEGLSVLQYFIASGNRLNGTLPPLAGAGNLMLFDVGRNELTGSLPSLEGSTKLRYFVVSNNQLTGSIPSLASIGNIAQFDVSWNHLTGEAPAVSSTNHLTDWVAENWGPVGNRSVLCPNTLVHTDNATWDTATGETPWYQNCVEPGAQTTLNQHGISGSWAFSSVDSQGFVLEAFPDMVSPGVAYLFAGWFTFDHMGNQRWYTVQGAAGNEDDGASLTIYASRGGSFASTQPASLDVVGTARLLASDCTHASLSYAFDDGTAGSIPLTRLSANANCAQGGDNDAVGRQLLSGGWADVEHTDSQGMVFDIDMAQNVFFGAWYTFLPAAAADAGYEAQHWYTFQSLVPSVDFTALPDIGIYDSTGGLFMQHVVPPPTTAQVGNASLEFHSCSTATLNYQFASGPNAGRQGTLDLLHIGPLTPGCTL